MPDSGGRTHWLTREELCALLLATKQAHARLFIELAIATGARSGALFDLTWEQVNLHAGSIDLNPRGRAQTTKHRPAVKMTARIHALLRQQRKAAPHAVHVLEIDGEPIEDNIRRSFRTAVVGAKLDPSKITPNTLRHTAASWMVQAGISLKEVAEFLGHRDSRMVEKHYGHLHPAYQNRAVQALDLGIDDTLTPQQHPTNEKGLEHEVPTPCLILVEPRGIEPLTSTMPL
ncbi:MAG: site-specific integrase [Polyangiaceae bacterium]